MTYFSLISCVFYIKHVFHNRRAPVLYKESKIIFWQLKANEFKCNLGNNVQFIFELSCKIEPILSHLAHHF